MATAPLSPINIDRIAGDPDPKAPLASLTDLPSGQGAAAAANHGLPTPSSLPHPLPNSRALTREVSPPSTVADEYEEEERMERSASEGPTDESSGEAALEPFAFDDVEMGGTASLASGNDDREVQDDTIPDPAATPAGPAPSFSSSVLIHRPYRARYSLASPPPLVIPMTVSRALLAPPLSTDAASAAADLGDSTVPLPSPSYKRSFEQVTPSSGTTPPATDAPGLSSRREFRHSFESQRAVASSRFLDAAPHRHQGEGLRRRLGGSRDTSRDRREDPAVSTTEAEAGRERDRSKRRREGGSPHHPYPHQLVGRAPGLEAAQFPLDPVLTTSTFAPSTLESPPLQPLSLPPSPRLPPSPPAPSSPLSPRRSRLSLPSLALVTRASPPPAFPTFRRATSTSYRLAPQVTVGQPLVLTTATSSALASPTLRPRRSAAPSRSPSPPTLRPRPARAQPDPMRERELDPWVAFQREQAISDRVDREAEVRLGEARDALDRAERTLSGHISAASPPPLPPDEVPSSPSSGSSRGRAMQFLSTLRARRPRLARNASVAGGDAGGDWDEAHEAAEAERLTSRIDAARAARAEEDSELWGDFGPGLSAASSRRMRGPTERANEIWRMGGPPGGGLASRIGGSTPREVASSRQEALSAWRAGILPPPVRHAAHEDSREERDGNDGDDSDDLIWQPRIRRTSDDEYRGQRASFPAPGTRRRISIPTAAAPTTATATTNATGNNARSSLLLSDEDDDDRPQGPWRPLHLPLMLASGSEGRRIVFPHPADVRSPFDDTQRHESMDAPPPAPRLTHRTFEAAPALPPSPPPLARLPPAPEPHRDPARRTTLADALAHLGSRSDGVWDSSLRRRPVPAPAAPEDPEERVVHRQGRTERLASLRRERAVMQTLLGVARSDGGNSDDAPAPRSPGRRRNLGDFLRGMGGGGGRFGTLFDDDFSAFFGRDSAALDPRNYLDDDDFDTSYESLLRLSERLGDVKPKGVSADKLAQLRRFPYSEWPLPPRRVETPALGVATTSAVTMDEDVPLLARRGLEKEERCAVCLMDYEETDEVMLGHCLHGFHADCLLAWLKEHAACPVCRRDHAE